MASQDKSVTILGATCNVHSVQFSRVLMLVEPVNGVPQPSVEKISATAYGSANRSDGTKDNESVTWILAGAAETTVRNFMDAQAVTRLRQKMGLETP